MGKISRIQLRGISRTPSDRLTEDGGCAESLNVSLDNAELAPAFVPEDVTEALGLPDDMQADRVFVHKTANYENIIIKEGDYVYANVGQSKQQLVHEEGMALNDITAVGNTVMLLTSQSTYYVLFREGEYTKLGTRVPLPKLSLFGRNATGIKEISLDIEALGVYGMYRSLSKSLYNKYKGDNTNSDEMVQKLLSAIYEQKVLYMTELGENGVFWGPIYVMYGVTMYDGSVVTTTPELLSRTSGVPPAQTWGLTLHSQFYTETTEYVGGIDATLQVPAFRLSVNNLGDYDISGWRDVIQSIDIYVSLPIDTAPNYKRLEILETEETEDIMSDKTDINATTIWGIPDEYEQITNKGVFYKIKSFDLGQFKDDVITSIQWDSQDTNVTQGRLASSTGFLPRANIDHVYADQTGVVGGKAIVYNDKVIVTSAQITYRYSGVSGKYTIPNPTYSARYKFILNDGTVVYSEDGLSIYQYGLILFPGINATRMEAIVKREKKVYVDQDHTDYELVIDYSFIKVPMSQHPSVFCSYAYIGLQKNFAEYAFEQNGSMTFELAANEVKFDEADKTGTVMSNKLFVSSLSNPFIYPETKRVTFQSEILGVAIATTALSQGQFGQFPLYVFTEDGIWAMETTADGSFVTSKPLSRDVCVNPDSITSIDQAVVFVTEKGVMLLSGSQIVDISPDMKGRHYSMEETAKTLIKGQPFFCELVDVLTDSTPFMAFMKKATIAYDYPGRRLVCIAPDEMYQYIFKLDTRTWHKTAHGRQFLAPINSYPECLVQGEGETTKKYLHSSVTNQYTETRLEDMTQALQMFIHDITKEDVKAYLDGDSGIDVTDLTEEDYESMYVELDEVWLTGPALHEQTLTVTRIYDISTVLDAEKPQQTEYGVIATRPLDLDAPDVLKTITDLRVRGDFPKGAVKYILLGSMDGVNYYTVSTRRGKAWKLFRIIILADLEAHNRISWVDINYETRFSNRLR